MEDVDTRVSGCEPKLISVLQAAAQLGVHPKTVRAHFELIRVGDRTLVRVADIAAKISGGRTGATV